eukprot:m51a1_g11279 putative DNA/RNA non-specific endonuclease (428) ;mRNA; f:14945-16323
MPTAVVNILAARNLAAGDADGSSDPYVVVYIASVPAGPCQRSAALTAPQTTRVAQHTLNPAWNQEMRFEVASPAGSQVSLAVWDKDYDRSSRAPGDALGTTSLALGDIDPGAAPGDFWLPLHGPTARGLLHVRVRLVDSGHPQQPQSTASSSSSSSSSSTAPDCKGLFHAKYAPRPGEDIVRHFAAFTVCFDGPDDDDGDGVPDLEGVPTWVANQLRARRPGQPLPRYERPRVWATDAKLHAQGVAPDDSSYRGSGMTRGHMCRKRDADRMGAEAGSATHTVMNACPQSEEFNSGVWLILEDLCERWADRFGSVWIMSGPIFTRPFSQVEKIGDRGETPVWVPDAFWKVVVREESDGSATALSFRFDHRRDRNGKPWRSIIGEDGRYLPGPPLYNVQDYLVGFKDLCAEARLQWPFPCPVRHATSLW